MRIAFAATLLFSLLVLPVSAATFVCPLPQALPATLNLQQGTRHSARTLAMVQAYLSNLKYIQQGYTRVRNKNQRAIVAECLILHVATLEDTRALQSPHTRADGATWFMFRQEVNASMAFINPQFLRTSIYTGMAQSWLSRRPAYGPKSPYNISAR